MFRKKGDFRSLKIVDFGLARVLDEDESLNDMCGTQAYWSPEIYLRRPHRFEVDMFAFGVMVFQLLLGQHPFPLKSRRVLAQHAVVLRIKCPRRDVKNISGSAQHLLRMLLTHQERRWTVSQAMEHWNGSWRNSLRLMRAPSFP